MSLIFAISLALLMTPVSRAQSSVALAGWGYAAPAAIPLAPGQIVLVTLYGLPPRPLEGFNAYDPNGNYTTLNSGISVLLVQSNEPGESPVAVYAVQQTTCSANDHGCTPLTVLTLRLPFELQVPAVPGIACKLGVACGNASGSGTFLRVFDQGAAVAGIAVNPVSDSIHFLNSCDQTLMHVSVLSSVVLGACTPLVQHINGQLVTPDRPARPGEVLITWAYGLGTTNPLPPSSPNVVSSGSQITVLEGPLMPATQTFDIGFTLQPNTVEARPVPSLGVSHPLFSGLRDAVGLYQVNIALPAILPDGRFAPCDGVQVLSNFAITMAGVNSVDTAPICVSQ